MHQVKTKDMNALEGALHSRFKDKQVAGEWFDLASEDVEWLRGLTVEQAGLLVKQQSGG